MKIFYAIQGTGNGHLSRAVELYPYLKKYGEVDFLLSGSNAHLNSNLPIKYKSKGLSLFYKHSGGLDYMKIYLLV
jgi:UDP-N-acetylglucosamine:LPS N-acetylglucosamine transferase